MEFGATFTYSEGSHNYSQYREYSTVNGYKRFYNKLKSISQFSDVKAVVKTYNNKTVKSEG